MLRGKAAAVDAGSLSWHLPLGQGRGELGGPASLLWGEGATEAEVQAVRCPAAPTLV